MSGEQDHLRVALHSMGIPVRDDWTVQEMHVKRDLSHSDAPEVDVYGNSCAQVEVVGQQVTLVLYRPEN